MLGLAAAADAPLATLDQSALDSQGSTVMDDLILAGTVELVFTIEITAAVPAGEE